MRKTREQLYDREAIWTAIKEIFNPTVQLYELGDELVPVTNSEKDEEILKTDFFQALDNISVMKKINKRLKVKLEVKTNESRSRNSSI